MKQPISTRILFLLSAALTAGLATSELQAELVHRYSFTSDVSDSVGNSDGTLVNNTGNSQFTGGQLVLANDGAATSNSGTGDYVDLPNGLISDLVGPDDVTQFTLEAWYTWSQSGGAWQRIWDFGISQGGENVSDSGDGTAQIFATPNVGGNTQVRTAWRGQGSTVEENLTFTPQNPAAQHHLVFVWDETNSSASFYLDGTLVGRDSQTAITIAEDIAGFDLNNFLGRSQWDDTLYVGSYNEFRIYNHAMDTLEVARSSVAGPDSTEPGDLGAVTALSASLDSLDIIVDEQSPVSFFADFENITHINVTSLSSITSNNENVATVSANGVITGLAEGAATITGSYEGQSASVEVAVSIPSRPPATLVHRYDFSGTPRDKTLVDLVGDANGVLISEVAFAGDGTASFMGQNGYINLPNGLVSSRLNLSIEAWATFFSGGGSWQRLWDFGTTSLGEDPSLDPAAPDYTGGTDFIFAPRTGGIDGNTGGRFSYGGSGVGIDPPAGQGIPLDEEVYIAAVYNYAQRRAELWFNGVLVGTDVIGADALLSNLPDVNCWLGRSQWKADARMLGTFNEFRMYEGALSPLEIAVNASAGPDTFIEDPGAVVDLRLEVESTERSLRDLPLDVTLVADFENISDVNLTSVPGTEFISSDPDVVQILESPLRLVGVGVGEATVTAALEGQEASVTLTVSGDVPPAVLAHRYSFEGDLTDPVGGRSNNELRGGAAFANGAVVMSGDGYVNMENFLFSDFFFDQNAPLPIEQQPVVCLEMYGRWNGGAAFQRLWDFGDNTVVQEDPPLPSEGGNYTGANSVWATPADGAGMLSVDVANQTAAFPNLTGPGLVANEDFYIAAVFDPQAGVARLYRNGVLVDVEALGNVTLGINDINVWLGRSNWSADPLFNGSISEFRIWTGFLTAQEVALHALCGPDELECVPIERPEFESITLNGDGTVTISWMNDGTLQMTETLVPSNWQDVTDTSPYSVPTPEGNAFFRLVQ